MSGSFEFDDVDAFVPCTIGRPGERIFFLQARSERQVVSVKCEKQQVAALSDYLGRLLVDLPAPARSLPGFAEMHPITEVSFIVGPMGLAYDADVDRFVLMIEQLVPTDDDGEPDLSALEDQGHLRLRLTRAQAVAFCEQAAALVGAGRPNCVFCGQPKNPDRHACPRMN